MNTRKTLARLMGAVLLMGGIVMTSSCENKVPEVEPIGEDAYSIVLNSSWNAVKEGLSSGWELDNRGGYPRSSLYGDYGTLNDISDGAGTALIRHLNKTTKGVIDLFSRVTVDGSDGAYIEYRSDTDASVYRLEIIDGAWQLIIGDTATKLLELGDTLRFDLRVSLDLDNGTASTNINGEELGSAALAQSSDALNLKTFRYATTDAAKTSISPMYTSIDANYALKEDFSYPIDGKTPIGWTLDKTSVESGLLKINKDGSASVGFKSVGGKAVTEFMLLYNKAIDLSLSMREGEVDAAVFRADGDGFKIGDELVYATEFGNLWYRLRFEVDTDAGTVLVKVNGREVANLPLAEKVDAIDNLIVTNKGIRVSTDNFKVFRVWEREDYVPEPVVPTDSNEYIVGMNVCSLWRNGAHFGWSCISPYDDPHPVLGYYDEGIPETADWEIKYIVEHGIDFQAFCIYMDQGTNAQRPGTEHLYDGFMNAKYSSLTKFCVIWECANAGSPSSMDEWQKNYVPYFIENYFKDPRHITIDNRLVLCVFGSDKLSSRLGGNANVKKAFEYLNEEVKKYGFDGMIYLACGSSSNKLAEMGFDGCYAYNWGNSGYSLAVNTTSIEASARQGALYTVPTISVGFNSIPWHQVRYPMMSMTDYAKAHEWVKSEYLTTYPKESWQKKLVMLSTWNEYGEGTYIMPTTDEKGFGYIDVIREAYTDEKADPALNTVPNEAQLERINHLYPQDFHLLRKNGEYGETINYDALETIYKIDYSEITSDLYVGSVDEQKRDENGMSGISNTTDPMYILSKVEAIDLDSVDYIRIKAKLEAGSTMQMFFITESDKTWNESKGKQFTVSTGDDELTDYYIRADQIKTLTGKLAGFRIDPTSKNGARFTIKSAEFLHETEGIGISMNVVVDTIALKQHIRPFENDAGVLCLPFDPTTGIDYALNCFHEWNKDTGRLTLSFRDRTIVFTLGSDKYSVDGEEKPLGFALEDCDKLPLIPIELLCREAGLGFELINGVITITTENAEYRQKIEEAEVPGRWEFNFDGYNEGWSSSHMSLNTKDGAMICKSTGSSTDPIISYGETLALEASKYKKLEVRVRYKYTGGGQHISVYFATDRDSTMDENKSLKLNLVGNDSGTEWKTLTLDLTKIASWKDTITKLRFDPFNAVGTMEIDYIRFLEE